MTDVRGEKSGNSVDIQINITFGRRILNQMLTAFLPSFCICLVSFSTNHYQVYISWMMINIIKINTNESRTL